MKQLVIIAGVSGSGKTTVQNEMIRRGYVKPANFTTRKPRGDYELDEYVFLDRDTYLAKLWNGDMIGANQYNGNHYGTGKFDAEKVCIVLNGVGREDAIQQLAAQGEYNITTIFLNISKRLQEERLTKRGDEREDVIKRLKDRTYFVPRIDSLVLDGKEDPDKLADKIECEILKKT